MRLCLSSSTTLSAALGLAVLSSARKCQNMTVEVPVDARNAVFNLTAPSTNIEVTNFILNQAQQGHNYSSTILTGVSRLQIQVEEIRMLPSDDEDVTLTQHV